jgi:hypothetical protein
MTRLLIARMNVSHDALDEFNRWYDSTHMEGATGIPGFGTEHRRYRARAVEGKYWNYVPDPEFTAIYQLQDGADLKAAIDSDEYKAWSGDFVAQWRGRTSDEVSRICRQIHGPEGTVDHKQMLIAQMNVDPNREDEFHAWYNDEHIPQASQIPGFGDDHRRYESIELQGKYWHYKPDPKYMSFYKIEDDADVLEAINSPEYKAWSGDFLARWRDGTSDEISTIMERIL